MTMWDFYERYFVPLRESANGYGGRRVRGAAFSIYLNVTRSRRWRRRGRERVTQSRRWRLHVSFRAGSTSTPRAISKPSKARPRRTRRPRSRRFGAGACRSWARTGDCSTRRASKQIQTLLFGGSANQKTGEILEREREFDVDLPASELPVVEEERDEEVLVTKEEFYAKATAKLLKEECQRRDLKVTGTKQQLVERLRNADAGVIDEVIDEGPPPLSIAEIDALATVAQMKDELRKRSLKLSGKKDELRERLLEDSKSYKAPSTKEEKTGLHAVYEELDLKQLQAACHARSLEVPGESTREQLLALLTDDDSYTAQLSKHSISSPKTFSLPSTPKKAKRKLTVRSVGLVPQKFTQSGWASCTADVLRDLAGTPKEQKWGRLQCVRGRSRGRGGLRGPGRVV